MASGVTIDMIELSKANRWRTQTDRPTRTRDRSLRGKDRVRARKVDNAINKALRSLVSTPTG